MASWDRLIKDEYIFSPHKSKTQSKKGQKVLVVWRDFFLLSFLQCSGQSNVDGNMGRSIPTDNLTHISNRRAADIQKMYLEGDLSAQPVTDELVYNV